MILKNYFDEFGSRVNPGQYFFGGPKAPSAPKQQPVKMPQMPEISMPAAPPPPAPIPPAPTQSKMEVQEADADARRQAARRKGVRQSLIAGETGGYTPADTTKKSLLG